MIRLGQRGDHESLQGGAGSGRTGPPAEPSCHASREASGRRESRPVCVLPPIKPFTGL